MKVVSSLVLSIIFFAGCSQKVVSSKAECREMESKIIKLEQEKNLNLAGKIAQITVRGYPLGVDEVKLNQNIKVLKMKLDECNR
jgi:PBP1b-binding outer membrane lipoprotein LpoB